MKINPLKVSIGILSTSLLAACGGDPKTGTIAAGTSSYDPFTGVLATATDTERTIAARFLDAPVSGLQYESTSKNGTTGIGGGFYCVSGEVTEFKIGSLSLGSAICQGIVTPQTLTARVEPTVVTAATTITSASGTPSSTSSKTVQNQIVESYLPDESPVVNRVRLLMSLDEDQNAANGIKLPLDLTGITTTYIDFANDNTFESQATTVIEALYPGQAAARLASASASAAINHFQAQLDALSTIDQLNYDDKTGAYIDLEAVSDAKDELANQSASNQGSYDG